ncbi:MAG: hypothetical protein HY822_05650 [Acidobacteria bacterium]|nr:hypothetical protein [Acidobacteriota bacterium]
MIIGPGLQFKELKDLKAIAASLVLGFLVGGLLTVEKLLNWQEAPPITIDSSPDGGLK